MAVLSAHKLEKSFGGRTLFADVSFEIAQKDHIGLVGANGTGKTTLIQILLGQQMPSAGEVHRAKLLKIGCLEQAPEIKPGQTLYELTLNVFAPLMQLEKELEEINGAFSHGSGNLTMLSVKQAEVREQLEAGGGLVFRKQTRATLLGLGFTEEELSLPASVLSGGQLNKAMLARVLLSGAELLFLDEPTNHLDFFAVEWLENYLKSYAGAYIVISHDRYFLDQVTNRTFELKNERFLQSKGNYSQHIALCATEQEIARRHYFNTQREIKRIYGIVEQQRRWNRERNIRTAESKLKQIDRLKATLREPEKQQAGIHFSFHVRQPGGNEVLVAEGLKKAYGDKKLFENADMLIRRGERVCLLGANGCGKTTLLRILTGNESADEGLKYLGAGVEAAYYEQNMRSLNAGSTVLQELQNAYPRMKQTETRNALAAFLFRGSDVDKNIGMLSGGEKARVQLLKLMLSGANLLLLDEPTNHLDIASREALEQSLEEYDGALLMVTHDRYLVNRIADRVLYMQEDGLTETIGGYDAFAEAMRSQPAEAEIPENAGQKAQNAYHLQKEYLNSLKAAKATVNALERKIEEKESEVATLEEALLAAVNEYMEAARLSEEIAAAREILDNLYADWEQAQTELSKLTDEGKEE